MAAPNSRKKTWNYIIILTVFAVTGSTAAIFPRWIMPLTGVEKGTALYVILYVVLITPIYQVLLLGYAFLFGKFHYFYSKQKKMLGWMIRPFRKRGATESSAEGQGHAPEKVVEE